MRILCEDPQHNSDPLLEGQRTLNLPRQEKIRVNRTSLLRTIFINIQLLMVTSDKTVQ